MAANTDIGPREGTRRDLESISGNQHISTIGSPHEEVYNGLGQGSGDPAAVDSTFNNLSEVSVGVGKFLMTSLE